MKKNCSNKEEIFQMKMTKKVKMDIKIVQMNKKIVNEQKNSSNEHKI